MYSTSTRRKNFADIQNPPSSSDVPYAYSDDASASSSSPVASSAVLESSVPNSPTDYAHVRDHSSPRRDYYYAYPEDRDHAFSKLQLPDSRNPPSDAYSSASPLSPLLSSFHLPTSYNHSSLLHEHSDPPSVHTQPRSTSSSQAYRIPAHVNARKKASKKAGGTTVQTRKTKPKFNRSSRVVYSDLESGGDDDDEETPAANPEVLPALKPKPEPTHEEEEVKKAQKPRGRKRKADLDSSSVPQKRSKKARSVAPSEPSITSTTRKRTRPLPTTTQPSPPSSPSKHLTPAQLGEKRAAIERRCPPGVDVSEMEGMIVEALGSARASSLAVESVWRAVKSARPGLEGMRARRAPELQSEEKTQNQKGVEEQIVVGEEKGEANTQEQEEEGEVLEKREWLGIVQDVLEYGRVTSGVFGRVESSFKDEHAHALPPHYFYVPENDADADRAAIIRSIMPRPAKRSETKKYKQYYWKPLGKVSRWDSEDAIPFSIPSFTPLPERLKYCDAQTALITYDEKYIVTTPNMPWVPSPVMGKITVQMCNDGRFGLVDPLQHPQLFSSRYPFLAAIPTKPTNPLDPLCVIWRRATRHYFECTVPGSGLGRLNASFAQKLADALDALIQRIAADVEACRDVRLKANCARAVHAVERLESVATYRDTVRKTTCVQRYYLYLTAYVTWYFDLRRREARMRIGETHIPMDGGLVGAVTTREDEVQELYRLGVPVWYLQRPEAITKSQILVNPADAFTSGDVVMEMDEADGRAIYEGCAGTDHLSAVWLQAHVPADVELVPFPTEVHQVQRVVETPLVPGPSVVRTVASTSRSAPYPKRPPKPRAGRDKFRESEHRWMPAALPVWAAALESTGRPTVPILRPGPAWRFWIPEPGLVLGPGNPERQHRYITNWLHIREAWLYAQGRRYAHLESPALPSQQWRELLNLNERTQQDAARHGNRNRTQQRKSDIVDVLATML
ncbi:hypothetical protein EUX98_g8793 [Antrodiella citrinella]|uniref:Uncharacterized protein n=1 Tax=Antrodiella citrinella TaxID=2447956 RepID=A0A4V6S1J7_9APHY|nr:hypothetical protein EUX98_g8793 [Antrodiella citrinella]